MARQNAQIPLKEKNNFKQGRDGAGTVQKSGPATKGKRQGGPIKGGGVFEGTKGKY